MIISVNFDTVSKQMDVQMDGESVLDVSSVNFYKRYSDVGMEETFQCEICQCESNPDTKVYSMTRTTANEHGVKVLKDDELKKNIIDFLTQNRK